MSRKPIYPSVEGAETLAVFDRVLAGLFVEYVARDLQPKKAMDLAFQEATEFLALRREKLESDLISFTVDRDEAAR